jgi:threonine/homoserine/homoserine lactone efflux protein
MLGFLLKGLLVGFAIAAPVGPIGVLCIRRSLAEGARVGFVVGLGAAAADAVYGAIAGFGLTAVSAWLVGMQHWLGFCGGLLLIWFGWRTLVTPPPAEAARAAGGDLWHSFLGTFLLTLTNPATILSFVAIFAGLGLVVGLDYASAAVFVTGVFVGSAIWWLMLAHGAAAFRTRMTPAAMRWVNRGSGFVVLAFGLVALVLAVRAWPGPA